MDEFTFLENMFKRLNEFKQWHRDAVLVEDKFNYENGILAMQSTIRDYIKLLKETKHDK